LTIRVIVADDQAPFRRAARSVLAAAADFQLVGEAMSGEEVVVLVGSLLPDLVLMDINMTGIGGIEATRSIAASYPHTMTILVSTYSEDELPRHAFDCGAAGYLYKSDLGGPLLRTLWERRSTCA